MSCGRCRRRALPPGLFGLQPWSDQHLPCPQSSAASPRGPIGHAPTLLTVRATAAATAITRFPLALVLTTPNHGHGSGNPAPLEMEAQPLIVQPQDRPGLSRSPLWAILGWRWTGSRQGVEGLYLESSAPSAVPWEGLGPEEGTKVSTGTLLLGTEAVSSQPPALAAWGQSRGLTRTGLEAKLG